MQYAFGVQVYGEVFLEPFINDTQQTKTREEPKIIWCISHEWPVIIPW